MSIIMKSGKFSHFGSRPYKQITTAELDMICLFAETNDTIQEVRDAIAQGYYGDEVELLDEYIIRGFGHWPSWIFSQEQGPTWDEKYTILRSLKAVKPVTKVTTIPLL